MNAIAKGLLGLVLALSLAGTGQAAITPEDERFYAVVDTVRAMVDLEGRKLSSCPYTQEELIALVQELLPGTSGPNSYTPMQGAFMVGVIAGYAGGTINTLEGALGLQPGISAQVLAQLAEAAKAQGDDKLATLLAPLEMPGKLPEMTSQDMYPPAQNAPATVGGTTGGTSGTVAAVPPMDDLLSFLGVRDLRQYYITNDKVGNLLVFEGQAANEFVDARSYIRLEVELVNGAGQIVARKSQMAGTVMSPLQLQTLTQEDLEAGLNDSATITAYNSHVPSGGRVPFMIVFYNPPEDIGAYTIRFVDARRP